MGTLEKPDTQILKSMQIVYDYGKPFGGYILLDGVI
jgi:hypothetical protein